MENYFTVVCYMKSLFYEEENFFANIKLLMAVKMKSGWDFEIRWTRKDEVCGFEVFF